MGLPVWDGGARPGYTWAVTASKIVPYPDGPLILRGDFAIEDVHGQPIEHAGRAVALCRCGRSQQKPFCDGTHKFGPKAADA